jgi:hypothetical protein
MGKPKVTLAVRILLLQELLDKVYEEERAASIAAHHAFENVREHLEAGAAGKESSHDWNKLQICMWKTHALEAYLTGKLQQIRDEIQLLKS